MSHESSVSVSSLTGTSFKHFSTNNWLMDLKERSHKHCFTILVMFPLSTFKHQSFFICEKKFGPSEGCICLRMSEGLTLTEII